MTRNGKRRIALYSIALIALAGLAYGGFVYEAEPDVGTLVNSAEVLAQIGSFEEAIEYAEGALRQDPDNRYAHVILGYSYGQTDEVEKALVHYERALSLTPAGDPNRGLLELYHAELLVRAGRPDEAVRQAEAVLSADPDEVQALYVVAKARRAQKSYEAALEVYRTVEERLPSDPAPSILMAEVEEERGNTAKALEHLDRVAELVPDDAAVRLRRARLLASMGRDEAAVAEIQSARRTKLALTRRALRENEEFSGLIADPRIQAILGDSREAGTETPEKR